MTSPSYDTLRLYLTNVNLTSQNSDLIIVGNTGQNGKERVILHYNDISLKISLILNKPNAKVIFHKKTKNASTKDNSNVKAIFTKPLLYRVNYVNISF